MKIEYNGECFNVRPAKRQDLGTPETAEDVRPLFVGFTEGEKTPLRRVYVPSKAQLDPPVYFVKNGGELVAIDTLGETEWCDAGGFVI